MGDSWFANLWLDEPYNVRSLGCEDFGPAWNSLHVASSSYEKRACLPQVNLYLPEVQVSHRQMEVSLSVTLLEVVASSCRS